jgi:hypothetical protein
LNLLFVSKFHALSILHKFTPMEHLPYPPNPVQPPLDVIFFCSHDVLGGRAVKELRSMPIETLWAEGMKDAASNIDNLRFAALAQAGSFLRMFMVLHNNHFDAKDFISGRTIQN